MPTAGPETIVDAPPLLPPVTGLLQAAAVVEHANSDTDFTTGDPDRRDRDHWLAGIAWTPASNQAPEFVDLCTYLNTLGGGRNHSGPGYYYPFAVDIRDECSYRSFDVDEFRARAREGLLAREWGAVEQQLEAGALNPANPHLAAVYNTNDPPDANTAPAATLFPFASGGNQATSLAFSPKDALALADETIAMWGGGLGMIHAPAYVVDQWVSSRATLLPDLVISDNPTDTAKRILFSPKGNIIVAGNGYRGYAPDGTLDATHAAQWIYVTDLMVVHRDADVSFTPDNAGEAVNRTTNVVQWRAWRAYAIEWSRLLHAAIKVNTTLAAAP